MVSPVHKVRKSQPYPYNPAISTMWPKRGVQRKLPIYPKKKPTEVATPADSSLVDSARMVKKRALFPIALIPKATTGIKRNLDRVGKKEIKDSVNREKS